MIWNTKIVDFILDNNLQNTKLLNSSPFWKNNLDVRKPNIIFSFTDNEIDIIKECKKNIVYFSRILGCELIPFQTEMVSSLHDERFYMAKKSKKVNTLLPMAISILHNLIFKVEYNILLIDNKKSDISEMISKVKELYEKLPFFLKNGVVSYNQYSLHFDNGTSINGSTAKTEMAIGNTINHLIINNVCDISSNIFDEMYKNIYPTLAGYKNSKINLISENKYGSHFNDFFSEDNNIYKKFIMNYDVHPNRDDMWVKEQIQLFGEEKFQEKFEMSDILENENENEKINTINNIKKIMKDNNISVNDL